MTYTDLERRYKEGQTAYPLLLFRYKHRSRDQWGRTLEEQQLLQRWRIHGENGWYEDWIEIPELEQ